MGMKLRRGRVEFKLDTGMDVKRDSESGCDKGSALFSYLYSIRRSLVACMAALQIPSITHQIQVI